MKNISSFWNCMGILNKHNFLFAAIFSYFFVIKFWGMWKKLKSNIITTEVSNLCLINEMLKIQLALLCMFSQVHFPSFHTEKPSLCLTLVFNSRICLCHCGTYSCHLCLRQDKRTQIELLMLRPTLPNWDHSSTGSPRNGILNPSGIIWVAR